MDFMYYNGMDDIDNWRITMKKITFTEKNKNTIAFIGLGILFLITAFFCFYKLGVKYVDPWDEARHGVNAYEMLKQKNLFQNTYLYQTDFYNLKPPFSMWCQMISFAILGANGFSLRFYSGICYLILTMVCARFMWKKYGRLAAVLGMALLAVNTTPFAAHMIRAGDADSLYVLFFTLAMLCMMEIQEKSNKLYLCGLFFSLAFLTKSYHAGVIVVIGGLFLLFTGELKKMKLKNWLYFLLAIIVPILVWAIPRFAVDGMEFFKQMLLTDVLGRTDGTLKNNIQPFGWYASYYLGTMSTRLTIYLWALVSVVAGLFYLSAGKKKEEIAVHKNEILGFGMWILIPFLAFSSVSNKLLWYLYPVTIPLLLCMAIVLSKVILDQRLLSVMRVLAAVLAIVCIFIYGKDVYNTIQSQTAVEGNDFQNLVRITGEELRSECGEEAQITAAVVYGMDDDNNLNTTWAGQDVFVAEAYGDFICVENLTKEADADMRIFFVSKACSEQAMTMLGMKAEGIEVLGESEEYIACKLK